MYKHIRSLFLFLGAALLLVSCALGQWSQLLLPLSKSAGEVALAHTHESEEKAVVQQREVRVEAQNGGTDSAVSGAGALFPLTVSSDTTARKQRLDSLKVNQLDSLVQNTRRDTVIAISGTKRDTTKLDTVKINKTGLDAPVQYTADDSLIYDMQTGEAQLYGKSQVDYQNMQLKAERINMNMDSALVYAFGLRDSLSGEWLGTPEYKQGSENYESERMAFNFRTKKGFITNVTTKQGNGFMRSVNSKRSNDGFFYLENARYTTCDADHPHFYLQLTRAKVKPGKETFFGPAYLVVADVPLPLAIPFGFFPFNKKYSSGIIMPTYGDETERGFYLREGGYYFAINDRIDLKLLGEIYTKGSWGLSAESNYAKRYRYRGNFFISYLTTIRGEKNFPDYSKGTDLKLQWSHSSDTKAYPNTSFSARVNFASQGYERSNLTSLYTPLSYTQSMRSSSVSFTHTIPSLGLNISGSTTLSQNMRDSTLAINLPELSFSVSRFYPFRRQRQVGKERWYEKISMSYTGSLSNSVTSKERELFEKNLIKDWRNGMQHRIPIDANFQLFKYINITPSFNLTDRTYFSRIHRSWDRAAQREIADTVYGVYNLYDWNTALSLNTTLYGFYKPWQRLFGERLNMIRHVFKPAVSFSYSPDFTTESFGYTRHYVKTDELGNVSTVHYSPYANGLYGYPNSTTAGSVSLSFSNNIEMKLKSENDTTGYRKISIIDELGGSISYNFAAKTRPWSDLNLRLRLKLTKSYTFSLAANFATYAYEIDDKGQVYVGERTEYSYGRFGRFQGMSQNLSYTLNNEKVKKLFALLMGKGWGELLGGDKATRHQKAYEDQDDDAQEQDEANIDPMLRQRKVAKHTHEKANVDEDGYLIFSMPWSISFSYGVSMREDRSKPINLSNMRYPWALTQTLNFSGNISLAKGWNINFSSGYDFNYKELSMTTASLSRKLHDFTMSCNIVLRPYSSFNFSFRADAAELADILRYEKRSAYSSNVNWY